MLAAIALRNLFRNRRRTAMSLAIVSIGVTSLLMTLGFVRYSFDGLSGALIRGGLAHFEIAPSLGASDSGADETDRSAMAPSLRDWHALRDRLEHQAGVRAVTGSILLTGMLANGDRTAAFLGTAVEPDRQRKMDIAVRLRRGDGLADAAPVPGEDKIVLGLDLARALHASPGDTIVAMVNTPDGSLNAVDLTVAGLATTGVKDLDARMAQMHLATAQRLLSTEEVTSLLVGLDDGVDIRTVGQALRQTLTQSSQKLDLADWESRAPYYGQVRGLYIGIFVFLGTIIGLLITLSTSNTLQMSVMERVREFGMLMAIGTDRRQLAGLVTLEAIWLAVIGAAAGSIITIVASTTLNALHIKMPPPPGAVDPVDLAVTIHAIDFGGAAVFMLALLVAATVPPMIRIFRLQVAEALTHV